MCRAGPNIRPAACRFVGMKSRGVYETPGGTILLSARRAIESLCLDRGEAHLKVSVSCMQNW